MNCKPGDMAVLIYDVLGIHDGKIFEVVAAGALKNHWKTFPVLVDPDGNVCEVYDPECRPIRDPGDDAVDEMTLLAGKPEGVTA